MITYEDVEITREALPVGLAYDLASSKPNLGYKSRLGWPQRLPGPLIRPSRPEPLPAAKSPQNQPPDGPPL